MTENEGMSPLESWLRSWPTDDALRVELHTEAPAPTEPDPSSPYARSERTVSWGDGPVTHDAIVWQIEGEQLERTEQPGALDELAQLVDVPPLTAPQVQGDVFVLPWLDTTTPNLRAERADSTREIPAGGCAVTEDGSHLLLPNGCPTAGVKYAHVHKGNTLGTLLVEPGHAARLSHREHADLLIGPGLYVLHSQRRWQNRSTIPVAD